jgi:hypothetical protein
MLADLPRHCSLGVKAKEGGNQHYWRGYKLHLDVADGQIPISAVLTAASLHDSYEHSRSLGHMPIIRPVRRQHKEIPFSEREEWEAREMTWAAGPVPRAHYGGAGECAFKGRVRREADSGTGSE